MVNKVAILRFLIIALLSVVSVTSYAYDHTPKNCCNYLARPSGIKIQPFLESCFATGETASSLSDLKNIALQVLNML